MNKIMTFLTAGVIFCTLTASALPTGAESFSGTHGSNIKFTVENGVLTLTGTGEIGNFSPIYDDEGYEKALTAYCEKHPDYQVWDYMPEPNPDQSGDDSEPDLPPNYYDYQCSSAPWGCYGKIIEKIVVGEGITSIGSYAFCYTNAKSVTLPDTLQCIGANAFCGCVALTEISLPDSLTEMDEAVFENCSALETYHWPSALDTVPDNTFSGCNISELVFPLTLKHLGFRAFEENPIKTLTVPDTLESIDSCCFAYTELESVIFPDNDIEIGAGCFSDCKQLTSVHLPANLQKIPDTCFSCCDALAKIELPKTLKVISDLAFYDCPVLTGVTLPDSLEKIGEEAFWACRGLTEMHLPDSLKTIGEGVFGHCENLRRCNWPAGLEEIPRNTFYECMISEPEIPATVKQIGSGAFGGCPIRKIVIPESVESIGSGSFGGLSLLTVEFPDTEIQLNENCLSGCTNLQNVHLPSCLTELPYGFFSDCKALKTVEIPESCVVIGGACFHNCTSLSRIDFPKGLKEIGESAFQSCTALRKIRFPESLDTVGADAFSECNFTELELPPHLTKIEARAFSNNAFKTLTIPSSVRILERNCFADNRSLESIVFPDSDIQIGMRVLSGCSALKNVQLPSQLTKLSGGLFAGCTGLNHIEIPQYCTVIGDNCFAECTGLQSVTIPESVRSIERDAFYRCTNLKSVHFSEGIRTIGAMAFDMTALHEIRLPESIEKLERECFWTCPAEQVILPERRIAFSENALPQDWLEQQTGFVIVADHQLYQYRGDEKNVQIPEGIRSIQSKAFGDSAGSHPVSITLSQTVDTVESGAFNHELEALTVPANVSNFSITATQNCPYLKEIRGEYLTSAQVIAKQTGTLFSPLHEDSIGETVEPDYDTAVLPFGNNGGVFGDYYMLRPWHRAMVLDVSDSPSYSLKSMSRAWSGSCYGLSAVTVLAQCGILKPSELDPEAKTLHDVRPIQQALEIINYYQFVIPESPQHSSSDQLMINAVDAARGVNHGRNPFILVINTADGGGHAVVGYGLEEGKWEFGGVQYDRRVLIWDSNYNKPDDKVSLYVNRDTLDWTFPAYGIVSESATTEAAGALRQVFTDPAQINHAPYNSRKPLAGDADCNEQISSADAVLLARYLSEDADISYLGIYNADLSQKGYADFSDIIGIFRLIGRPAA
ncbi:MAG: leucine-rich repeat protein [Oscillospiraceae bacterium]|nr:leucine-rich repeat protein [Oscillospiraceae bacterium]